MDGGNGHSPQSGNVRIAAANTKHERFARMLEEKGICGNGITQQQLEETMRKILGERAETPSSHDESERSRITSRTTVHFWPSDGKLHTLPETFEFPSTDVLHAWLMWRFGNEGMGFPPLKSVSTSDLSTRKKRQTYSEWSVMMQHISQAVERCTGKALPTSMTQQQATALCITGVNSLRLGGASRRQRATQLKITTMLRLVREAKHVERNTHT
ncbi:hypothetical protein L914_20728 [Phytophthora nicotianae]|nr:hypothetical protein L914_20728 [Phytophthora nicotianae]